MGHKARKHRQHPQDRSPSPTRPAGDRADYDSVAPAPRSRGDQTTHPPEPSHLPGSSRGPGLNRPREASREHRAGRWKQATPIGLFALTAVAVLMWLDPALQATARTPVFYLDWPFLRGFLVKPGGLLEWLAAALFPWYRWPGPAVAIAVAAVSLAGWAAFGFYSAVGVGARPVYLSLVALVPLVALQSQSYEPLLQLSLGLALVWLILGVYARWPFKPLGGRLMAIGVVTALVFYLAGGLVLPLAAMGMVSELRPPRPRWASVGAWLVCVLALPWFATRGFNPDGGLASCLEPFWPRPSLTVMAVGLTAVALAGWRVCRAWGRPRLSTGWGLRFPMPFWLPMAALMVLLVTLAAAARNPSRQARLRVDYHARRQDWPAVLAQVPKLDLPAVRPGELPAALVTAYIDIRRALFHVGRLTDDLFALPCPAGMPLLPTTGEGYVWCIPASELLLELGHVNYAEHWAHEALEVHGEHPELLLTLATINQLLDRPHAARIFLNRLSRNPAWAREARHRRAQLDADPAGDRDPRVQQLRSVMVKSDHPSAYLDTETLLRVALAANPRNRMASEYLLAHYLLQRQLDPAIALIRHAPDFGFAALPRHAEEAWVLWERLAATNAPAPPRVNIRPAVREQFRRFEELSRRYEGDPARLRAALRPDSGGTFWFYEMFGETPGCAAR